MCLPQKKKDKIEIVADFVYLIPNSSMKALRFSHLKGLKEQDKKLSGEIFDVAAFC